MKDREFIVNNQLYIFKAWLGFVFVWLMLAVCIFSWANDFSGKVHGYSACPVDSRGQCFNSFYGSNVCGKSIPLDDPLCTVEFIQPGEYLGEPPSWLVLNYSFLLIGLGVLYLFLNHFLFNKDFRFGGGAHV